MDQQVGKWQTTFFVDKDKGVENKACMKTSTKKDLKHKAIRHIAVSNGGHCDHRPPETVRNGLEVGVRGSSLRKINCA